MDALRTTLATDPRLFGRRSLAAPATKIKSNTVGDDLRLFAMTFAAGFLFMSVFLG